MDLLKLDTKNSNLQQPEKETNILYKTWAEYTNI